MGYQRDWQWRRWLIVVAVCAMAVAAYTPVTRLVTTVRLITAVRRVAAGNISKEPTIQEERMIGHLGTSELSGVVYRRSGSAPVSAIVLIPGVSELGCYHPRLMSLARALAATGFLVVTPDITMFREFRIYPPPLEEISFWLHEAKRVNGGEKVDRIGLAGISFSGTLSLIVASQPQNRDLASYVLGIGSFDDLIRCSQGWFAAGPVTVAQGFYPTRFYAKWIIMLAAIDMLPAAEDRQFLQSVLHNLLVQQNIPTPPHAITEVGRRWLRLALMREDQADPDLSQQIEAYVAGLLYPALSTGQSAADIRCPVFLAHGAHDDLIPPEESYRLQKRIVRVKSYLLISPFLTHTHPWERPMNWWSKARAGIDFFGFLYRLAGVL